MHQVVLASTFLFWVKCNPSRTFPQRSLGGNPRIDPHFLPTAKPHSLNTLTRDIPPMYWLGTSRCCPGPCWENTWIKYFLIQKHAAEYKKIYFIRV